MKKYIIAVAVLFCMSCGSNSSSKENTEKPAVAEAEPEKTEDPEVTKGMQLIAGSDCLTCHNLTATVIGPSYAAIAEKYKSDASKVDYLAEKIIKGGSGVWGTVAMAPHVGISEQDAKSMVAYIMTIKN